MAINTRGRTSHCEDDVRAGHRKAPSGKVGARTRVSDCERTSLLVGGDEGEMAALPGFLPLRRGLCGDGLGGAMLERLPGRVMRSPRRYRHSIPPRQLREWGEARVCLGGEINVVELGDHIAQASW